jgi:hypothetical protein
MKLHPSDRNIFEIDVLQDTDGRAPQSTAFDTLHALDDDPTQHFGSQIACLIRATRSRFAMLSQVTKQLRQLNIKVVACHFAHLTMGRDGPSPGRTPRVASKFGIDSSKDRRRL